MAISESRSAALNGRRLVFLNWTALAILFLSPLLGASPSGKIWGQVRDGRRVPVAGAAVRLTSADGAAAFETASDAAGFFCFLGLPPGSYDLRAVAPGFGVAESRGISLSDTSDVRISCFLSADSEGTGIPLSARVFDVSAANARTTILASQIELLPSGLSIGSLIENQDLSATTNRIDVGGLWSDLPTLFSARGGVSWTQNVILLNGMDVGDPYETGQPLLLPDVPGLSKSFDRGRSAVSKLVIGMESA